MQLTDQMKAELIDISKYIAEMNSVVPALRKELHAQGGFTPKDRNYIAECTEQVSSHKVQLENFLCKTDLKEQDH